MNFVLPHNYNGGKIDRKTLDRTVQRIGTLYSLNLFEALMAIN